MAGLSLNVMYEVLNLLKDVTHPETTLDIISPVVIMSDLPLR
jgi:hypothetical protein